MYEPDHETSYWGDNYAKLLSVKHKYDPHGLLDCWQCGTCCGPPVFLVRLRCVLTNVFVQSAGRASPTPCTSATSSSEATHAKQLIYSLSLWVSLTDRWSR